VATLIIRGEEDRLSSPEWVRRLARLMPDARLAGLPGLGHDAFGQDPGAVARVAAPFLGPSCIRHRELRSQAW
jgi:pimeloyl-ACP methyl ester carboxylesterase